MKCCDFGHSLDGRQGTWKERKTPKAVRVDDTEKDVAGSSDEQGMWMGYRRKK